MNATTATLSARTDDVASDAAPELPRVALPPWWAAYAHARHCVEQRETDLAARLLRTLCDDLPQRAEPYTLLAHVLRASGQMQEASELAQHALALPIPTDGTQLLEPDAWRIQPLEELAISSWHLKERAVGQLAAERIVHSRAATRLQRVRAVRHSGWYMSRLQVAWRRRLRVAPEVFAADESASTPTIVRSDDGYLLLARLITYDVYQDGAFASRGRRVFNNNAVALLDRDAQPTQWSRLDDALLRQRSHANVHTIGVYGIEDLRVVWWQDAWWFVAMTWHFTPTTAPGVALGRLAVDADGARVEYIVPLTIPERQPIEKNWLPFVHNGELLLIYHAEPLTILRPDVETGVCTVVHQTAAPLALDTYRGSTAPIPWNDGYLYIVHAVGYDVGHSVYQHRFVELDSDLRLRRISLPFHLRDRGIEYLLGLTPAHDGEHLLLSHSWMDAEDWISAIRREDVEELLLPLGTFMVPASQPDHAGPNHDAGLMEGDDTSTASAGAGATGATLVTLPDWWTPYRAALQNALYMDLNAALAGLTDLIAAWPGRPEMHYQLARIIRQREEHLEAFPHATQALSLALDLPDDGSELLEPDSWNAGPLHETAISAWYADAHDLGRSAADLLIHDRRLSQRQREAGVEHASWYLSALPLTTSQPIEPPDGMLSPYEAIANGSIAPLPNGDSYLLAQRVVNYACDVRRRVRIRDRGQQVRSRTLLAQLDPSGLPVDWQPLDASLLDTISRTNQTTNHTLGLEDLRLLHWQDAWWFAACTCQYTSVTDNDMLLGRLTLDADGAGARVEHLVPLTLTARQPKEKNWLPFVDAQGDLRLLYQSDPLTILAADPVSGLCEPVHALDMPVAMEHYRGSAGPLRWGAGYLYAVHEVATFHDHVVYQHRFVELDLDYRVQRISLPFFLVERGIEFVLGMCMSHDGSTLLLHHSQMDARAWVSTLPLAALDQLLLPVEDLIGE